MFFTTCSELSLLVRELVTDEYGLWPGMPRWPWEGFASRAARVASVSGGVFNGVDISKIGKKESAGMMGGGEGTTIDEPSLYSLLVAQ
jgi:hypothetical protein